MELSLGGVLGLKAYIVEQRNALIEAREALDEDWHAYHRWLDRLSKVNFVVSTVIQGSVDIGSIVNVTRAGRGSGKKLAQAQAKLRNKLKPATEVMEKEKVRLGRASHRSAGRVGGYTASVNRLKREGRQSGLSFGLNGSQSIGSTHLPAGPSSVKHQQGFLGGMEDEYRSAVDRTAAVIHNIINDPGMHNFPEALGLFLEVSDLPGWLQKATVRLEDSVEVAIDKMGYEYALQQAEKKNEINRQIRVYDDALKKLADLERAARRLRSAKG